MILYFIQDLRVFPQFQNSSFYSVRRYTFWVLFSIKINEFKTNKHILSVKLWAVTSAIFRVDKKNISQSSQEVSLVLVFRSSWLIKAEKSFCILLTSDKKIHCDQCIISSRLEGRFTIRHRDNDKLKLDFIMIRLIYLVFLSYFSYESKSNHLTDHDWTLRLSSNDCHNLKAWVMSNLLRLA